VLTRLPPPARRTPGAATRLLTTNFPGTRFLSPESARILLTELATKGIAGGSVYDALVGATAAEHRLTLATRDRRAVDIYRSLNVTLEVLA
jgi:predicted nucleic acid-binding protein